MVSCFSSGSKPFSICGALADTLGVPITGNVTIIDSLQYHSMDYLFLNWPHLIQFPLLCRVWVVWGYIENASLHTCPLFGSDALNVLCIFLFGIQAKLIEGKRTKQRALSWRGSAPALYIDIWDQEPVFSSIEFSQPLILNKERMVWTKEMGIKYGWD